MSEYRVNEVVERILSKRETYERIIANTFSCELERAGFILDSELELFSERAKAYYMGEKNPPQMTELQGMNIFVEVLQMGLSFNKASNHVYFSRLKGTGVSVGYQVTVNGLLYLAQKSGAISHVSEVVIVKQGEPFKIKTDENGKFYVEHEITFDNVEPFSYDQLSVGYVYVTYSSGDRELHWMSREKLDKSKAMSQKTETYNEENMLKSKIIKNALRYVRKTDVPRVMESSVDAADVVVDF